MGMYKTVQGDTWDLIAYKQYGDEKHMKLLAEANRPLLDYMILPSGIEINVPELPEGGEESTVFWRKGSDDETYSSVEEDGNE